ncbi:MAG: transketolase [Nitrospirota bacterium]
MDITRLEEAKRQLAINTIKMLSVDAVEKAKSGHPGLPMGFADIAFILWMGFLRFNPEDPLWIGRDRFILSPGHGSALLYSLLHLFGYSLPMEELKQFRQFKSLTPGHPEYRHTPGVETTTGPLGQGMTNAIGMALAERIMAERFNKDNRKIIDHYTYSVVSDGDLMEGITSEGASFAGHLGLSRLICIYADNRITIEGKTGIAFSEDVGCRFEAYNWHVQKVDGYQHRDIYDAIKAAQNEKERPSLIIAKTNIGMGSPNRHDSPKAHGEPLGEEELKLTKSAIGWPADKRFYVPDEAREIFECRINELKREYDKWMNDFKRHKEEDREFSGLWDSMMKKDIPSDLEKILVDTIKKDTIATRSASGDMMQEIAIRIPSFLGGSADLSPSTKTFINNAGDISKGSYSGRNIHFGIREHAMGGILNGMAVYGGIIPFGSTFLVFSDYMRPSIRLAALMKIQVIYIFTHDSIFVGEDGPTHEPIEHVASLRLIPDLLVIRPSDATETAAAWIMALEHKSGPTALILTRQNLPVIDRKRYAPSDNLRYGGYILIDCKGLPEIILMASGSEVSLAVNAALELQKMGIGVRVVSLPCHELFDRQTEEYRNMVLPEKCMRRVAIEAGSTMCWHRFAGNDGLFIGIDRFGASAPASLLSEEYGFTVENILNRIDEKWGLLKRG